MWKRLDPLIATSEKHVKLGFSSLTLWVMMLPHTDTKGRYWANAAYIKGQCLPLFDHVRLEQVEAALLDLQKVGLIHLFDSGSKRYLVFHDVQDFNPPGALRYNRPQWPEPPEDLCKCVSRRESGGIAPPISASSGDKRRFGGEKGSVAQSLVAIWNDGPGEHLSGQAALSKVQAALDVGVPAQSIEQAFWDHQSIKGRKIWEVLDPLRPKLDAPGIPSMDEIIRTASKIGEKREQRAV